jgi:hypothetical protein
MKKFYLFMITLFVAIAANAVTLTGSAGLWDSATKTSTNVSLDIEATIDGGVVTLPNFLGSDKTFTVTVYTDGTAEDGEETGSIKGSFTIGEKTYSDIYIYAGSWDYPDFTYSVTNGVKTLHFGFYAESDWYDLNITLPDDFTPAAPADPYEGKTKVAVPIVYYDGTDGAAGTSFTVDAVIEDGVVTLIDLFGLSAKNAAKYTIDEEGNISSSLNGWLSTSYTYNETTNSYIYAYGNQYLSYDAENKVIKDYIWLNESYVGFYFTAQLPDSRLTATAGLWDNESQSAVNTTIKIEAEIDGAVVTLPNFLGSDKTFKVTVYSDGTAEDGESAGSIKGSFTIGEKTYSDIYIYAGSWDYPDFTYSEKDGVKTLHFGFYAENDWYDLNITLPEDFEPAEPAEPVDPYANKISFDVNLTLSSWGGETLGTETAKAYISGNQIIFTDLLGAEATYTIADDAASSTLNGWVATTGYNYNGTDNTYFYSYGKSYLSYDAETRTVKDYLWLNESNLGFYISFQVPEVQELSTTVSKYSDWLWQPLENGNITVNAIIDGSVVTLIDYLGEGLDLQVTAYNNGKASHDKSYGAYKGIDFDGQDIIELYAGQWGYDDFSYSEKEGKVLSAMVYLANSATVDDYTTWGYYKIDTTLPEDYEAVDPYADKDVIGILVSYGASDIYNAKAYIEDNTLVFTDLFGASEIVYTVTEDGGVVTENYGWYPCDFEFDGEAEDYIMVYGYTTYDATTGIVTDQIYGDTTGVELTISFALPKALRPTTGISDINVDENAPVEYFNLQGVRVNNPASGLFIRRQGGKAQKVVVK